MLGHVHVYQRFLPVLGPSNIRFMMPPRYVDYESVSADGHTYTNSKYMPTIVAASPGDEEITGHKLCPLFDTFGEFFWRNSQAKCSSVYGYGRFLIFNTFDILNISLRWCDIVLLYFYKSQATCKLLIRPTYIGNL